MIRVSRAAVLPLAALSAALVAAGLYLALQRPGGAPAARAADAPAITVESAATPLAAPTGPLPVLRAIPAFHLSAASGEEVGREELLGQPWVAGFIFTTCAGACPLMMAELVRLHDALPADRQVRIVAITVDPEHDTAEVLRDYALKFGATGARWRFLRGTASGTYALAQQGFQLGAGPSADPAPGDGPFFHSDRLVLVDAQGNVRGYYRGTETADVDRLRHDLNRLAAGA
jgi:protein SCO1/2